MDDCGLGYMDAVNTYECMVRVFEDAVVSMHKVNIGHVGAITPKEMAPKQVAMNFKREKDKLVPTRRDYYLGKRVKFTLALYRSFVDRTKLNWF